MAMSGIPNTVRLMVATTDRKRNNILYLGREILEKLAGIQIQKQVLCIQEFPKRGQYDVTFEVEADAFNFFEVLRANADKEVMENITFAALFQFEEKVLYVHVYNPKSSKDVITNFLHNYCDVVKGGWAQKGALKVFNGEYKYLVRFKKDISCVGGVKYPPSNFSVAGIRGYLYYKGQPSFCRQCFQFGHVKENCLYTEKVCRNCGKPGHVAGACPQPKKCDICGEPGHLYKNCPEVERRDVERGKQEKDRKHQYLMQLMAKQENVRRFIAESEQRRESVITEQTKPPDPHRMEEEVRVEEVEEVKRVVEETIEDIPSPVYQESQNIDWSESAEESVEEGVKQMAQDESSGLQLFRSPRRKAKKLRIEAVVPPSVETENRYEPLLETQMDTISGGEASPEPLTRKITK